MKKRKNRSYEGLPVKDANSAITLHVTKADVNNATKNNPAKCAAALAGKREYKKEVRVFLTRTYVKETKCWKRYINPEVVSREIISFDRGSTFVPGTYKVNPPREGESLHKIRSKTGGSSRKSKNIIKKPHHMTAEVREFDSTQMK